MSGPVDACGGAVAREVDVAIVGGGLAGLTLALHLKQAFADLDVLVVERRGHPVPEAAHKVGESTVEIAADYFADVLGLRRHLEERQIKKFGFRFFMSEGRRDLDGVTEIGASRFLTVPSWQIDRGIFENFLGEEARRRGIDFVDGARVGELSLQGRGPHRLVYEQDGRAQAVAARWLVDAGGRAGLLRRKLGLDEANGHAAHAVWFRIGERLAVDDWSDDPAWRARCDPPARWQSTNHLCGAGYWVWLIPLASGSHSVGIVADPALHPLESMNGFDKAMQWIGRHQPALFERLDPLRGRLQDFAFLRRFSHGCRQVFSADRWALTGEAGLFLDPFYSPGSDFIAIANTYIVELVRRDREGLPLGAHARLFDDLYHSFYASTLALYEGQYPIFGDAEVLPVKVIWDYAYYWGVLAQFCFRRRLCDLASFSALRGELAEAQALNLAVQAVLLEWSSRTPPSAGPNPPQMLDQASLPWFADLNAKLVEPTPDDATFRDRIRGNVRLLERLAAEIASRARLPLPAAAAARGVAVGDEPLLFPQPDTTSPVPSRTRPITAASAKPSRRKTASTSSAL